MDGMEMFGEWEEGKAYALESAWERVQQSAAELNRQERRWMTQKTEAKRERKAGKETFLIERVEHMPGEYQRDLLLEFEPAGEAWILAKRRVVYYENIFLSPAANYLVVGAALVIVAALFLPKLF